MSRTAYISETQDQISSLASPRSRLLSSITTPTSNKGATLQKGFLSPRNPKYNESPLSKSRSSLQIGLSSLESIHANKLSMNEKDIQTLMAQLKNDLHSTKVAELVINEEPEDNKNNADDQSIDLSTNNIISLQEQSERLQDLPEDQISKSSTHKEPTNKIFSKKSELITDNTHYSPTKITEKHNVPSLSSTRAVTNTSTVDINPRESSKMATINTQSKISIGRLSSPVTKTRNQKISTPRK